MSPTPDDDDLRTMLSSRPYTIDLPLTIERRLTSAARRIENDDRRASVPPEERIDALRGFEHVLIGMIDRGLDASEQEDGMIASPFTGRLRPRTMQEHGAAARPIRAYPARGAEQESPGGAGEAAWRVGGCLLALLMFVVVAFGVAAIIDRWI